jgi:hypothetical protein
MKELSRHSTRLLRQISRPLISAETNKLKIYYTANFAKLIFNMENTNLFMKVQTEDTEV